MSLNESRRPRRREKWPLEFDLAGIPRPQDVNRFDFGDQTPRDRQTELDRLKGNEAMKITANSFSDGRTIDLSDPPKVPYRHQEYPKMLHQGAKKKVVNSAEEEKQSLAAGWSLKPDPEARALAEVRRKQKESRLRQHVKKHADAGMEAPPLEEEEEDEGWDDVPLGEGEEEAVSGEKQEQNQTRTRRKKKSA